jgi:hypothetical protein
MCGISAFPDVHVSHSFYGRGSDLGKHFPCILYEANAAFEVNQVSANIQELLGIECELVVGCQDFWTDWLFDRDWSFIEAKLKELETANFVSFVHRILNGAKLPIWVSHSVKKVEVDGNLVLRGCLTPILNDQRVLGLDQTLITRFVHKLGNHFQLLNLVVGSLKKGLPDTRESAILFETLDKAAELTRAFADCVQLSSWRSKIQLGELLRAAMDVQRTAFKAKGVSLQEHYDERLDGACLSGDPFLLETAVNHVIADSLDAAQVGGSVRFSGWIDEKLPSSSVARLQLVQTLRLNTAGEPSGLPLSHRGEHDALSMTLAMRVIEMHGGILRIAHTECNEKAVEISLPVLLSERYSCE